MYPQGTVAHLYDATPFLNNPKNYGIFEAQYTSHVPRYCIESSVPVSAPGYISHPDPGLKSRHLRAPS